MARLKVEKFFHDIFIASLFFWRGGDGILRRLMGEENLGGGLDPGVDVGGMRKIC